MIKELKLLLYLITIILFLFLNIKYYLSEQFQKKVYRTHNNHLNNINQYSNNLKILGSNTDNVIVYVDNDKNNSKKTYQFWKLIEND